MLRPHACSMLRVSLVVLMYYKPQIFKLIGQASRPRQGPRLMVFAAVTSDAFFDSKFHRRERDVGSRLRKVGPTRWRSRQRSFESHLSTSSNVVANI